MPLRDEENYCSSQRKVQAPETDTQWCVILSSQKYCVFICNNFDTLTLCELKPTLINFHDDDELSHSKEVLLKIVTKALDESGRVLELP